MYAHNCSTRGPHLKTYLRSATVSRSFWDCAQLMTAHCDRIQAQSRHLDVHQHVAAQVRIHALHPAADAQQDVGQISADFLPMHLLAVLRPCCLGHVRLHNQAVTCIQPSAAAMLPHTSIIMCPMHPCSSCKEALSSSQTLHMSSCLLQAGPAR